MVQINYLANPIKETIKEINKIIFGSSSSNEEMIILLLLIVIGLLLWNGVRKK